MLYQKIFSICLLAIVASGCTFKQNKSGDELLPGELKPTFNSLKKVVFEPKCVGCHQGHGAGGGVDCSTYSGIMKNHGRSAAIVPGKPEESSIYTACLSGRMPKGMPHLSEKELTTIYAWIQAGAPEGEPDAEPSPSPSPPPAISPTYASIRQVVLQPKCLSCHGGPGSPGGVDLSTYETLIQTAVSPGSPEGSGLYSSTASGRMPKGGAPLSEKEVQAIYTWIKSGASQNGSSPAPTPSPVMPNYASLHQRIFAPKCIGCHSGPTPPHGIDLTSYEDIAKSTAFPPLLIPGKPEESSLYLSCETERMPKGMSPLLASELNALQTWIKKGAKKNESDPDPSPSPSPTEPGDDDDDGPGGGDGTGGNTGTEPCDPVKSANEPGHKPCAPRSPGGFFSRFLKW